MKQKDRNDYCFGQRFLKGKLLLPSLDIQFGKPLSKAMFKKIQDSRRHSNAEVQDLLSTGKHSISGPLRALDGPGSSLDLPIFQRLLCQKGTISVKAVENSLQDDFKYFIEAIPPEILRNGQVLFYNYQDIEKCLMHLKNKGVSLNRYTKFCQLIKEINYVNHIPMTLTVASGMRLTVEFERASNPDLVEYVAPDYGLPADRPLQFSEEIDLASIATNKQLYAPFYIFINIFGLKGVRIILRESSLFILSGGMESSNAFNTCLFLAATLLGGAQLTYGDLFTLSVKVEDDELDGITGGQGHICFLSPYKSTSLNLWTSGLYDHHGSSLGYGVFSTDQIPQDSIDSLVEHLILLQYGKDYVDGQSVIKRTAALTNIMWVQLLRDHDAVGFNLHAKKLKYVIDFVESLAKKDYYKAAQVTHQYVTVRNQLIHRWLTLLLAATNPKQFESLSEKEQQQSRYYYDCVFNPDNRYFPIFEQLRDFYQHQKDALVQMPLYSHGAVGLIEEQWRQHIAIMPLGAGGPGATLFCISEKTSQQICELLHQYDSRLHYFDDKEARKTLSGTGTIRGYLPLAIDHQGLLIKGFDGCYTIPEPEEVYYDQLTGKFSTAIEE